MARDFKGKASEPRRTGGFGSTLSFITGLLVGLTVAVVVYYTGLCKPPVGGGAPVAAVVPMLPEAAPEPPMIQEDHSALAPTNPRDGDVPGPTFDFYKILPEIEVKVPDAEIAAPATEPIEPPVKTGVPAAYVLQVGSFQRFEDADQAKAQLALQGITSTIQRVVIDGQDVWFRVHVGPYTDLPAVQAMRTRLSQAGANAVVLKIGGGPG